MATFTGILNLLIILSILVVVHEYGHFLFARLFKTRVDEFSLFFGKILLRLGKRGDTVYNVRALPFGGFVKIAGMEGDDISGGRPILDAVRDPQFSQSNGLEDLVKRLNEDKDADISTSNVSPDVAALITSSVGQDGLLDPERRADLEAKQLSPSITDDEKKLIQIVLQADSQAQDTSLYSSKPIYQRALIIFGGPLFSLLFGYLVFCGVFMASGVPRRTTMISEVAKDGAAKAAGILKGDKIVAIDRVPMKSGDQMVDLIHNSAGKPLLVTIRRGTREIDFKVTPKMTELPDEIGDKKSMGVIGVYPEFKPEKLGPVAAVVEGTRFTKDYMANLLKVLFSKRVTKHVSGPVGIAKLTIDLQDSPSPMLAMTYLAATFSISLAVMNLLPIPILDGGHLLLLGIEKIRRRRPTPREVYRAQLVGIAILAVIVCLVMYNDLARLITGRGFQ